MWLCLLLVAASPSHQPVDEALRNVEKASAEQAKGIEALQKVLRIKTKDCEPPVTETCPSVDPCPKAPPCAVVVSRTIPSTGLLILGGVGTAMASFIAGFLIGSR